MRMLAPVHQSAPNHDRGRRARSLRNTVQPSFIVGDDPAEGRYADTDVGVVIKAETDFRIDSVAGECAVVDGVVEGVRDDIH